MQGVIIAGIGTDVGKTVAAAVVAKALGADYWKPVQTGPDFSADRLELKRLVPGIHIHPETHHYPDPVSPHAAAANAGTAIDLGDFVIPEAERLVVELAGGLEVPLNDRHTNMDLIKQLGLPVILVSRYYLGSINHTMLSLAHLKHAGISCKGLVFNGDVVPATREAILARSEAPALLDLPHLDDLSADLVAFHAQSLHL